MLSYFSDLDEAYTIGVYSVDQEAEYICRKVIEITGIDLNPCGFPNDQETGEFSRDTVIIRKNQFEEDLLDLFDHGISIYITETK